MTPHTPADALLRIPFINVDEQDAPPCAVMQVVGSTVVDGVTFLQCARVGSIYSTALAVNSLVRVASGEKGVCFRAGDLPIAYDGGEPEAGQRWGVRAGQWTLSYGYPSAATVHGVRDSAAKILSAEFAPATSVIAASVTDLPAVAAGVPGSATLALQVWNGTTLVPASPPMYITGRNASTAAIKAGEFAQFTETDGQWLVASAAGGLLARFELTSDLVYGVNPGGDNARLLEYAAGSYLPTGAAIRVYDWTSGGGLGTWSGKAPVTSPALAGYRGWAVKGVDSERYEIVWMERPARFISFRLYLPLRTSEASAANCAVQSYWDGRDPDPTSANLTVYNLAGDYSGVYKFSGDANAVGFAVWNEKLGRYQIAAIEGDGRRWVLFKNVAGVTAPACGVLAQQSVNRDANGHSQKRTILTAGKPDATFRTTYFINGYADVPNNAIGVCCSTEGPLEALFDTGTPANGEGWGPKPGQFSLAKGFPGFRVLGLNSDDSLAVVVPQPLVRLVGKTTDPIAAETSSTSYIILAGAPGSEADAGFTTRPAIYFPSDIPDDTRFKAWWFNSHWEAERMGADFDTMEISVVTSVALDDPDTPTVLQKTTRTVTVIDDGEDDSATSTVFAWNTPDSGVVFMFPLLASIRALGNKALWTGSGAAGAEDCCCYGPPPPPPEPPTCEQCSSGVRRWKVTISGIVSDSPDANEAYCPW